jgi:Zn-finger nucleic acid-binding protein
MSALTCPKCHGDMRQYERSGVHVDQCTECRGVFLDRGELEGLVDAELRWAAQTAAPVQAAPAPAPVPAAPAQHGYQEPYPPQQQGYPPQQQYGRPPKKKRSFLEDIFD